MSPHVCCCCVDVIGFFKRSDVVKMIKQFLKRISCYSLSFHGDVFYIGSDECFIKWNVVTDAVVRLDGFTGLILRQLWSC
jgi:hypothetical protein